MAETIELENFGIIFSFHCPKCDYLNEEVSSTDLVSGNSECGMCDAVFKVEGLDAIKVAATFD